MQMESVVSGAFPVSYPFGSDGGIVVASSILCPSWYSYTEITLYELKTVSEEFLVI